MVTFHSITDPPELTDCLDRTLGGEKRHNRSGHRGIYHYKMPGTIEGLLVGDAVLGDKVGSKRFKSRCCDDKRSLSRASTMDILPRGRPLDRCGAEGFINRGLQDLGRRQYKEFRFRWENAKAFMPGYAMDLLSLWK